jgi:alpha-glucosidase (family GH31 glycosyl hydrolase)
MYVRWVQFGTFQPIDRLHSHHGDRLPWDYPGQPEQVATEFLRLRARLVPYLYTLSRQVHDTGMPMVRSLYLQWPELDDAYQHRTSFTLGQDMLVSVVATPGDPAAVDVWIPPGVWTDFFTGESFTGPQTVNRSVPLERYPVFMRAGAILPTQPDLPTSADGPQDNLTLSVWPGADGRFDLYDDEGRGFGYRNGAYSFTPISTSTSAQSCVTVDIGAAQGNFPGALPQRSWTIRLMGVSSPAVVKLAGTATNGWSYDATTHTLVLDTGARSTARSLHVVAGPSACATL